MRRSHKRNRVEEQETPWHVLALAAAMLLPHPALAQLPDPDRKSKARKSPRPSIRRPLVSGKIEGKPRNQQQPVPYRLEGKLDLAPQWTISIRSLREIEKEKDRESSDYSLNGVVGSWKLSYRQQTQQDRAKGKLLQGSRAATLSLRQPARLGGFTVKTLSLSWNRDSVRQPEWSRKLSLAGTAKLAGHQFLLDIKENRGGNQPDSVLGTLRFQSSPGRTLTASGLWKTENRENRPPAKSWNLDLQLRLPQQNTLRYQVEASQGGGRPSASRGTLRFDSAPGNALTLSGVWKTDRRENRPETRFWQLDCSLKLPHRSQLRYQIAANRSGSRPAEQTKRLSLVAGVSKTLNLNADLKWVGSGSRRLAHRGLKVDFQAPASLRDRWKLELAWAEDRSGRGVVQKKSGELRYMLPPGNGNHLDLTLRWSRYPGREDTRVALNAEFRF